MRKLPLQFCHLCQVKIRENLFSFFINNELIVNDGYNMIVCMYITYYAALFFNCFCFYTQTTNTFYCAVFRV